MSSQVKTQEPDLWMQYMRTGDFVRAWQVSDAILKSRAGKPCWHLPRHLQYIWDGSPLNDKKVLVCCYHGLGDTIQFIRYMPLLKSIAREVIVWAQPGLIPLLQTVAGIDILLPLHDGAPEVAYDADVEIMELAHVFRSTIESIPSNIPYLHVEPRQLQNDNKFSAGLVWKAGDWAPKRTIPFSMLAPLAEIRDVRLVILQQNATEAGWEEGFGVHPGEFDLFNHAKIISGLDLVISVDSMSAHLAGALGIPVWTLLDANADWRWMEGRSDSSWYPSMRLLRQSRMGEWEEVIAQVAKSLQELSARGR